MASIEYNVAGQQIAVTKDAELVENTVGVYDVKFTFDSSWSSFTDKTAVFVSDTHPDAPYEVPLDSNSEALIPAAVLKYGNLMIGVYGSTQTQQYPTVWAPPKRVWPGAGPGMEPPADPVFGMVVRTAPQELTSEQKSNARTNIGAAGSSEMTTALAGKMDKDTDGVAGNVAIIDTNGNAVDGGFSLADIYDRAMIHKTASGNIVTIEDGADDVPVKQMQIAINPVQAGSGDPSPSNVRAITGWTGAKIYRAKNNLYKSPTGDRGIVNAYISTDGNVSMTSDGSACVTVENIEGGKTYTLVSTYPAPIFRYGSKVLSGSAITGQLSPYYRGISPYKGTLATNQSDNMIVIQAIRAHLQDGRAKIVVSDGAVDEYIISFPSEAGTVYGGNLVLNEDGTGTLTVDWARISIPTTGMSAMVYRDGYPGAYATISNTNIIDTSSNVNNVLCEILPSVNNYSLNRAGIFITSKKAFGFRMSAELLSGYGEITDASTGLTAIKAYITANPVYCAYKLLTPVTYTLTVPQVKTLLGLNNIWADTGEITSMTYRADPTLSESEAVDSIRRTIAPIEDGATASQPYAKGDFLFRFGTLYKVTSTIASGGAFTVDTNISEVKLADDVKGIETWESVTVTRNNTYLSSLMSAHCYKNTKLKIAILFGYFTVSTVPSSGTTLLTLSGITPINNYVYTQAYRGSNVISLRGGSSSGNMTLSIDAGTTGEIVTGSYIIQAVVIPLA